MTARYRTIKIAGRSMLEHRYVMEQHLGRRLQTNEHVHHINENTRDNRLENLQVLSAHEHAAHHKQKHPLVKTCEVCEATYTPHPTKRERSKTCSKACSYKLRWESRAASKRAEALVRANVLEEAA
jgi:hypothetical protein